MNFRNVWRMLHIILTGGLLFYFGYREYHDPLLISGFADAGSIETVGNEESSGGARPSRLTLPAYFVPGSVEDPARRIVDAQFVFIERSQQSVETLFKNMQERHEGNRARLDQFQRTLSNLLDEQNLTARDTFNNLSRVKESVRGEVARLEALRKEQDAAQEEIHQALDGMQATRLSSGTPLAEGNFTFVNYEVQPFETLSEIARKVEAEHGTAGADLAALIPYFNELDWRLRPSQGNRPARRYLGNTSLRIPLRKTLASHIEESGLETHLQRQLAHSRKLEEEHRKLELSLQSQMGEVHQAMEDLQALEKMNAGMERALNTLVFEDQRPGTEAQALSPEEQSLWERFFADSQAFLRAQTGEERGDSERRLRRTLDEVQNFYRPPNLIPFSGDALSDPADQAQRWISTEPASP